MFCFRLPPSPLSREASPPRPLFPGALPATGTFALVLAIGACSARRDPVPEPEPAPEAPAEGSTTASAETRAGEVSPATATPEPHPSLVARRPDELIAALPGSSATLAFDVVALEAWAQAGVGVEIGQGNGVRVVQSALDTLIEGVEEEGALTLDPQTRAVAVAWAPDSVHVSLDRAPTAHAGGHVVEGEGPTVFRFGAAGASERRPLLEGLPEAAAITIAVDERSALPDALRGSLDFLDAAGVGRIGVAIHPDGRLDARLEASDAAAVRGALGRGQAFMSQALGQLRGETRPALQGWITYLNRVGQALYSRVELTDDSGAVALSVPAPTCGGPLRNLAAAAFVLTLADVAANDPRTPTIPYVAMQARLSEGCGPIEGPAPRLGGASYGADRADRRAVLVVADLAALLRSGLPTGFGLLPFALSDEVLTEAFGPAPMGLSGLDAQGALAVYARDRSEGEGSPASQGLVLPGGMIGLVGQQEALGTMPPFFTPNLVGWASAGFDPEGRAARPAGAPWEAALAAAGEGAFAAAVVNGPVLTGWARSLPEGDPLRTILSGSDAAVLAVRDDGVTLSFVGVPADTNVERFRESLPASLASISRSPGGGSSVDERRALVAAAMARSELRLVGRVLTVEPRGAAMHYLAATVRIGLPMLAGTAGRGPVGMPVVPDIGPFRAPAPR